MKQESNLRVLAAAVAAIVAPLQVQAQQEMEELVVTGVPVNQSPNELAQSVSVIAGENLDRIRESNLGETLAGQLGVNASYFGTGSSRPIIRGLAGPRVRMMEDGIDSLDVSTVSVDHAVSIDPLAAEQIEIFRGPTTLLYGSGAVGGVINTVTNRIPEIAPDDGFDGAVELRGDTVSNDRTLALALDGGSDTLAWHLDALRRDTDDYEIPGFAELEEHHEDEGHEEEQVYGLLENSDIEVDSFAGGLSWLGEAGFFGVSVSSFDTNYGLPGHHDHGEEAVRIDLKQERVDLKGGWLSMTGPVQAINLRLGVADYEHVELEGSEVGTRFNNDAWEGRLEIMHSPWGEWNGAFGLQLTERDFSAIGAEAFVPPTETTSYGLFMIEQRELDLWQVSLGARLESQKHTPTGGAPSVSDSASSFSLAAIRDLGNGYSLAFNGALAERLPVGEELYADGPHLATGNIEVGDATLGSETSRHVDFGIRKTEGRLTWSITAFVTDYADYIYLRDTGEEDPDEELPILEFTQGDADFSGIEAELILPLGNLADSHFDLRLFGDYVEGELTNGENLPRMPPRRFGTRLQYHNNQLVAGLELTRYEDQDKLAPFEEPTSGYSILNADLNWKIASQVEARYEIFLRATNLLDEDARRHTSFLKDTTPLPGRNYSVGFRASF